MNNDLKNILPNDEQKQHGLNTLRDDLFSDDHSFEIDAQEGLSEIPQEKVTAIINTLNTDLHRKLHKKKKKSREIPNQQTTYFTIITILLLAIIGYVVIKKFMS
jgi:hypothetical protein